MILSSEILEVENYHEAVELFFKNNWTDGLAIVPPTVEKVSDMINYVNCSPSEVLGKVPPRNGVVTIEKLAVNSVMAGCCPEYFPIIIAAFKALLDPRHNLNGVQTTTHCSVPLIIINGKLVKELNINYSEGVFGSGYRSNGTIGRAIRLILWNAGGNYPWNVDKSTMGHPGKWTYCIAENEEDSPWQSFSVDRGFQNGNNTVTVFTCEAPHSIMCYGTSSEMLRTICSSIATLGNNNVYGMGETLLVLNPRSANQFADEGWSKEDIKKYIWHNARVPIKEAVQTGSIAAQMYKKYWPKWVDDNNDNGLSPIVESYEDIHLVVAGGETYFAACCPGWGVLGGLAVTRKI